MYQYWTLKFTNQTEANDVLYPSGVPVLRDIDTIGTILDSNGIPVSGWHVNVATKTTLPTSLQPYVIPFPLFPKRVWFTNEEGAAL